MSQVIYEAGELPAYAEILHELARLSTEYEKLARAEQDAKVQSELTNRMRAYDRGGQLIAVMDADKWVFVASGEKLLVPSATKAGAQPYRTDSLMCNCEAGMHGRFCRHMAIAEAVEEVLSAKATSNPNGSGSGVAVPF